MKKTVTNLLKLSPTYFVTNIRHQHQCNLRKPSVEQNQYLLSFRVIYNSGISGRNSQENCTNLSKSIIFIQTSYLKYLFGNFNSSNCAEKASQIFSRSYLSQIKTNTCFVPCQAKVTLGRRRVTQVQGADIKSLYDQDQSLSRILVPQLRSQKL